MTFPRSSLLSELPFGPSRSAEMASKPNVTNWPGHGRGACPPLVSGLSLGLSIACLSGVRSGHSRTSRDTLTD